MVTYMRSPQVYINVGGTDYTNITLSADVTRVENGFDTATVTLTDYKSINYPTVTADATIVIYVKDQPDAAWTTIFNGIIVCCTLGKVPETLVLKCDGAGYGLTRALCAKEYGSESSLGTAYDTIAEILGDGVADSGIIHAWVNHILGDTGGATYPPSGYAYTTTNVATIAGPIKYVFFPYKPANRCIDDLCDLVTAIRAAAAYHPDHEGPHWIVDTANNIFLQSLNGTSANWPLYYGGTVTTATLAEGTDLLTQSFEKMAIEANHIVYYGNWRRSGSGDAWTENSHALWDHTVADIEVDSVNTPKIVGGYSLRLNSPTSVGGFAWYPIGKALAWDITKVASPTHTPTINFYFRRSGGIVDANVALCTNDTNNYNYSFVADLTNANEFYHFSFPIGPYWNLNRDKTDFKWEEVTTGVLNWNNINSIWFTWDAPAAIYGYLDGLYIGDVPLCRVAYNSTLIGTKKLKSKLIVDDVGKDDSLKRTDDSGTMAQMARAELLRCQTMPTVGHITTPMIKDLLPGERLHIHAKLNSAGVYQVDDDMRVPRLTQHIAPTGFTSEIDLTTDVTNSHPRVAHNDLNAVLANTRPEFQDRQAASVKAGEVDINVPRLELDYP
jgi:hypothetical protein